MQTHPTVQKLRPGRTAIRIAVLVLVVMIALPIVCGAATPEKWADPNLKVIDGLALWLDATAHPRAPQPSEPDTTDSLSVWSDASGHHRDFVQPTGADRPLRRTQEGLGFVSFDGQRTHLAREEKGLTTENATIFLVVAPYSNDGEFRGFIAASAPDANDYTTGVTIDQSWAATPDFSAVNVEGAGFGGAANLKTDRTPLLRVTRLCVSSSVGQEGTQLFVDGRLAGKRDRARSKLQLDRLIVGARYYGNGEPAHTQGFFDGEIAEVIVYDRALAAEERTAVDNYLAKKYAAVKNVPAPPLRGGSKRLQSVANPPAVQMLVPGFTARELPVELTNVNNVLYREDGKLVALTYSGDVYLLADTDGDGLEDQAKLYWEGNGGIRSPIGMALTPLGYQGGRGVFVASKGKISLLLDTDNDDIGDKEVIVASGWRELPHNVDSLGVAIDPRDGSVYFGLGCEDFTNAYGLTGDAPARYSKDSERGTILRAAADFKSRAVVATGIRFPVAIRFNAAGDLFCTDQEGATWLPNGNPLDELLFIERGRHYGFPPRHPKHLPQVIDEPSVFDYAPQHQSTCGLNFNEPVGKDGQTFGPDWWRGDALVTGYSRGKLYRTKLVKSAAGYVAQNQLIGVVAMLPADACVSPMGELVVAAHSGGPDWGSGPGGKGRLFKISSEKRATPRPVLAWAQTPRELRIAFDKPIDPATLKDVAERATIEYGPYVAAGDRFETLRPGYAVVANQQRSGRFDLKIHSLKVSADQRTLILTTAPHGPAAQYAVTLAGLGREASTAGEIAQSPETDLQYDLTGATVEWRASGGGEAWQSWIPHVDFQVSRDFTKRSVDHDQLWKRCQQPGVLSLQTSLDLHNMLRPDVQPGAKIDYQWPAEAVSLVVSAATPLTVRFAGKPIAVEKTSDGRFTASIAAPQTAEGAPQTAEGTLQPLDITVETGAVDPALRLHYFTAEDARPRALALRRFVLPWASRTLEAPTVVDNRNLPELAGGNWLRGREIFFGQTAGCGKCHSMAGQGGTIGPDLSNLTQRDYASVLRDLTQPSFAINPDFIAQSLVLDDGRVLTGSVRSRGDSLIVGDTDGRETVVLRASVEETRPSSVSIMPQGIPQQLGEAKLRDLLTYLLTDPPRMPDYGKGTPPPARSREEVAAVLAGAPEATRPRPLHVVLVAGPKDHGPGEHDYPAWLTVWQRLLSLADETRVTTANVWPSADDLRTADTLVFYQQGAWTPERARDIDAFLARGGGLVYIHFAVDGGADAPGFAQRIGLAWRGGASKFRHGDLDVHMQPPADHPIARNLTRVQLHDESYWNLIGDPTRVRLLGTGPEDGAEQPLFWTLEPSKGRVFVSIPGHFAWSFDDPLFRVLLLRGIAWTAREPVDRFNALVTAGARLQSAAKASAAAAPAAAPPGNAPATEKAPAAGPPSAKPPARTSAPLVKSKQGMVVTVSPASSDVGLAILERGGNAVDSAVATAFALAVTFPEAGNIGGGGFMMVWPGDGKAPVCIDYRETAPATAGRDTFVRETDLYSHKTVGVPGTVRGLALAHQKFGKLPWKELVAPAIELAEKGFVLDGVVARGINGIAAKETTGAEFRRAYGKPGGSRWAAGERLMLPDLARTLRIIADEGPDSFYQGAIAAQIVAEMKAGDGLISAADLAGYQAIVRDSVHGTYRGYDIYGPPPPSSGGTLIVEMLNILENFDLKAEPRWSPRNSHLVIEAMRRGFCDRARHIGDPDHVEVPGHLTTKEYAAKLAKTIDLDHATPSDKLAPEIQLSEEGESTTHFSIVDRNRMAVANTYTLQDSWGARIVVRRGGFLLNNEMTDFNWRPGHTDRKGKIGTDANLVAPGKRMLSSQTPTIVARDGKLFLVTGSPGGRTIPNTTLCVLLGALEFDLDARAAVDAPRIHQQWLPDRTPFEGATDQQFAPLVKKLRAMGHHIPEKASVQGDAHTIRVVGDTLEGAADARRTKGKAAGY